MGMHKALLRFGTGNFTFLEEITQAYAKVGVKQIIVVVNDELFELIQNMSMFLPENVKLIVNTTPERGRFHSMKTGLGNIEPGSYVFFQNVDNPFVNADLLSKLMDKKADSDVILPMFAGVSGHPVLISPEVCNSILLCENPEARIDQFLKDFLTTLVETDDKRILVNINTASGYYDLF